LDTVIKALNEVAINNTHVLNDPKPEVIFDSFGDSFWNYRPKLSLSNKNSGGMKFGVLFVRTS
jgi:hypothetical protein